MIPAEAVEAAAKAVGVEYGWEPNKEDRRIVAIALEAAAPYMMASVADSRDGDLFRFTWAQREWLRTAAERGGE